MQDVISKISDYSLEEIMGSRFGRYSKSIIQDRALPDVRDGLKPVQRRILYAMYHAKRTYDKDYVKSARSVGDIMGKFHPHGDSSIYDAMVRMSQWWKQNLTYIDMKGNNGSMDGDSAAAMRYTEAKLSKICNELMKDIDKGTIKWAPNFDDTELEPTVLPAKYPNLLVNGTTGISAGYATNIPPHNLAEVVDATIKRIDSPNCRLDTLLEIIKGPDFPTGAIVEGKSGIIDAFTTGRGKVVVKAKSEFVREKGKDQIIFTEIPFDVNKLALVKKMTDIYLDKKIDGISEIRDESDRENPVRIVVDLKKDANRETVLNYLYKNTELMINYNYNMVAIVNKRPMTLGLIPILDAFIDHEKEVITKRTEFDLEFARKRMHIVEGLIKALSILDEVIKTIRASKNKADAKDNLVKKYGFTEEQAEAIVVLQLYKLTNTDVTALESECKNLTIVIESLEAILSDENKLKSVMKEELRKIKNEYGVNRKTVINDLVTEIKLDTTNLIPKEECVVVVTNEGYVKRTSLRSFDSSTDETSVREGDYVTGLYKMNTMNTLLLFTNLGNYLYVPVYELPELKWKDLGKHISNIITLKTEESIVASIPVNDFDCKKYITSFTLNGMVKRTLLSEYKVQRYSKPITSMKLKEKDYVTCVLIDDGNEVFISTRNGYGLRYNVSEIPVTGIRSSGVKAINLKDDVVVSAHIFSDAEYLTVITSKNTGKRIKLTEFDPLSRAKKGVRLIREVKTNPYYILKTFIVGYKESLTYITKTDVCDIKLTELKVTDRQGTGSSITSSDIVNVISKVNLYSMDEDDSKKVIEKENLTLDEIDEKIMTIDDFLNEFEGNK